MPFKSVITYGRYRNRVIKTDLWITPERNRRLFSSSDSSNNGSTLDRQSECKQKLSSSSRDVSLGSVDGNQGQNVSSLVKMEPSALSLSLDRKNSPFFQEHSTPLSRRSGCKPTARNLKEISPLCSITNDHKEFVSPSLFSDSGAAGDVSSTVSVSCHESSSKSECNNSNKNAQVNTNPQSKDNLNITDLRKISWNGGSLDVHGISENMKDLRLLDGKVYLDSSECLQLCNNAVDNLKPGKSSISGNERNAPVVEDDRNPFQSVHLPSSLQPNQSADKLHDEKSGAVRTAEVTQRSKVASATPMSCQLNNKSQRDMNGYYSSFAEALTPLDFQRGKPLSPKQRILEQCGQKKPLKFSDALTPFVLENCVKVGEGTYGEVYKANNGIEDVALKVIPVEGSFAVNGEPQKSFDDMIPEIVISRELSNLGNADEQENNMNFCPNFISVRRVILVQDSYPETLLSRWDEWQKNHKCENERPDIFPCDQYFVVFEFVHGGEDMERFEFTRMEEALSVLQQVALSLSVSEQSLMFEHRDLHWGNVLIRRSKSQTLHYKLNGEDVYLESRGVSVSIIDFTLSRLTKDGLTVFCDLSQDPEIFHGKGDYQFEVYRLMRKANKDDWEAYVPYSNVLWIRYLIDKILNGKKYEIKDSGLQRTLRTCLRRVLSCDSAMDTLRSGLFELQFPTVQH